MIYLERVDTRDKLDFSQLPTAIDPAILCQDISMSLCVHLVPPHIVLHASLTALPRKRDRSLIRHQCLTPEELPTPGMVIAIDAEFVQLQEVRALRLL